MAGNPETRGESGRWRRRLQPARRRRRGQDPCAPSGPPRRSLRSGHRRPPLAHRQAHRRRLDHRVPQR